MQPDSLPSPVCHTLLVARSLPLIPVQRFEDCVRRCDFCGVGFSNARRTPVRIWADPLDNVPAQVHGGLRSVLARAANDGNREKLD